MRIRNAPDEEPPNEDDVGYTFPTSPSELRTISLDRLAAIYRRLAFANLHAHDRIVEQELSFRLVRALDRHTRSATRTAWLLVWLTIVLVVLTVVLVWLTLRLE